MASWSLAAQVPPRTLLNPALPWQRPFAANTLLPNPSLERTATGKPAWPRGFRCLSSASRPSRLTGVRPSAQTLGLTSNAERSRALFSVFTASLGQSHAGALCRRASAERWRSFGTRRLSPRCTTPSTHGRAFAPRHEENTRRESPPLVQLQPEEGSSLVAALRVHGVALVRHARRAVGSGRRHTWRITSAARFGPVARAKLLRPATPYHRHQVRPNPSLKRDCHRQGTWPARRCGSSSVPRAKRLPGVSPLAQTLGRFKHAALDSAL